MASGIASDYSSLLKRMPSPADLASRILAKTDGNGDNEVSSAEFAAGLQSLPSGGMSSGKIGSLFKEIDADKDGALTKGELNSYLEKLTSSVQTAMLDAQEKSANPLPSIGKDGRISDPLDTNGDGKVSLMEMLAGEAGAHGAGQGTGEMDVLLEQVKSALVSKVYQSMQERTSASLSGALTTAA